MHALKVDSLEVSMKARLVVHAMVVLLVVTPIFWVFVDDKTKVQAGKTRCRLSDLLRGRSAGITRR